MIRRPRRSIPAGLVALVLLAVCVLVVVAVVQSLLGRTPLVSLSQLLAITSSQQWNSGVVVAVAIVLALVGLVLLVAALRPGRPTVLPLGAAQGPDGTPGAVAGVRRTSLNTDLAAAAAAVPGVTTATVSARRRRVTAGIQVAAAEPDAVPGQVRERLAARLAEIGPAASPTVKVRARPDRRTT